MPASASCSSNLSTGVFTSAASLRMVVCCDIRFPCPLAGAIGPARDGTILLRWRKRDGVAPWWRPAAGTTFFLTLLPPSLADLRHSGRDRERVGEGRRV